MFPPHTLLSLLLVASTAVDASPVGRSIGKVALSFQNTADEHRPFDIVKMDSARVRAMCDGVPGVNVNITNAVINYAANLLVGDPPTSYSLVIDTGSANTWVGANKPYVPTKTSRDTGKTFSVHYGSGNVIGEEWNDTVSLSPSLVITDQGIGAAHSSNGLSGFDGILGLGPPILTNNTIDGGGIIPTVMNNLFSQGRISEETFGILFVPGDSRTKAGELTIGGYDHSIIAGPVSYAPSKTLPASPFWDITQSINYGSEVIMQASDGIVDTGTTLILIPSGAYEQYKNKTGGIRDSNTQLLKITTEQYHNLKPLEFRIGFETYELTANAQIWPRSLNTAIGGTADGIYLIVSDIGDSDIGFVLGLAFLERYYSVYDAAKGAVGFAKTHYTYADIN